LIHTVDRLELKERSSGRHGAELCRILKETWRIKELGGLKR
jgi:hypothetical protein